MKNVLIVAAHADDAELGCGATTTKHVEAGDKVSAFILCPERQNQAEEAAKVIGHTVWYSDLDDQQFDNVPLLNITKSIETIVSMLKPHIVYTHWIGDLNLDHQITARATLTACRPLPGSTVKAIYGFEIPSSTEWGLQPFMPTHFEVLQPKHYQKKMDALKCYGDEIKEYPHARSYAAIQSLTQKRACEVGQTECAEAFHTYRTIS